MSAMSKPMWAAMLAKLVSPMEPERAAKAIAGMMPAISFPEAAFTADSVKAVASTGRIMGDGSRAPMTRVPTAGEIESALGAWWWKHRERMAIAAAPVARERLPAPSPLPTHQTPSTEALAAVETLRKQFVAERSWSQSTGPNAKPSVKALPLSDGHLLAVWEKAAADGVAGADIRLAMLKKRMGAVT